jgi:putative transposase
MLLAHRPVFKEKGRCRDSFYVANDKLRLDRCSSRGVRHGGLGLGERNWTCAHCGARHDRDVNAAIDLRRLATGALAAQSALPVASPAATPGTAAGMGSAAGGKVTPVRDEHGQQNGSGQEENRAHFRAYF